MTDQVGHPAAVPTTVDDELAALRRIVASLRRLDRDAQDRVVGWLWDRFRLPATEGVSDVGPV